MSVAAKRSGIVLRERLRELLQFGGILKWRSSEWIMTIEKIGRTSKRKRMSVIDL